VLILLVQNSIAPMSIREGFKIKMYLSYSIVVISMLMSCSSNIRTPDPLIEILESVEDSIFLSVLSDLEEYQIQILYTQIDRDKYNAPLLTSFAFNVNKDRYFYPASTVKSPVAFFAVQRII